MALPSIVSGKQTFYHFYNPKAADFNSIINLRLCRVYWRKNIYSIHISVASSIRIRASLNILFWWIITIGRISYQIDVFISDWISITKYEYWAKAPADCAEKLRIFANVCKWFQTSHLILRSFIRMVWRMPNDCANAIMSALFVNEIKIFTQIIVNVNNIVSNNVITSIFYVNFLRPSVAQHSTREQLSNAHERH